MTPVWHASPNCGARRGGVLPSLVVLHYTAMSAPRAVRDWLCNPASQVSAHYMICPQGEITQMVSEQARAWHAGAGRWGNTDDVNSNSIGIELVNSGATPFAAAQMNALEPLLKGILTHWDIPPHGVIGHSDMAPGRKIDPGPKFDWLRLERSGLARPRGTTPPTNANPATLRSLAARAGYTAQADDQTLLAAIRLRYRPAATGPLTAQDLAPLTRSSFHLAE